jgi:hypothetical protein
MSISNQELVRISNSPEFKSNLGKIRRWELLPQLFKVKGKPFSLEGREQFSVLFSHEMVRELIVMSGRQLGKSMSLSRSELFDAMCIPNLQRLYIAPLQEQARIYSDLYVSEAIKSSPLAQRLQQNDMYGVLSDAKIIKSTGHQSFANGSGIMLTYAKSSADRVRGRFADCIDFDEVQDQSPDVVPRYFDFLIYMSSDLIIQKCCEHVGELKMLYHITFMLCCCLSIRASLCPQSFIARSNLMFFNKFFQPNSLILCHFILPPNFLS